MVALISTPLLDIGMFAYVLYQLWVFFLFWRFHMTEEQSNPPNFESRHAWYSQYLFCGKGTPFIPLSYPQQYACLVKEFERAGILCSKVTHASRAVGPQKAE